MGWCIMKKWVHNKKTGTHNLQSSSKPKTRTIANPQHDVIILVEDGFMVKVM